MDPREQPPSSPLEFHEPLASLREALAVREKLPVLAQERNDLKARLASPDLSIEDRIALTEKLRDVNAEILTILKGQGKEDGAPHEGTQEPEEKEFHEQLDLELTRQRNRLFWRIRALYPREEAERFERTLDAYIPSLRVNLHEQIRRKEDIKEGHIPFILVVRNELIPLERQAALMEREGKKGFTALDLSELKTAEGVEIPESMAYLALDVENGKAMLGRTIWIHMARRAPGICACFSGRGIPACSIRSSHNWSV